MNFVNEPGIHPDSFSFKRAINTIIGGTLGSDKSETIIDLIGRDPEKLIRIQSEDFISLGLTRAQTIRMMAAISIARLVVLEKEQKKGIQLRCSQDIYHEMRPVFMGLEVEEFWVIYLNRANRIIRKDRISLGGISGTVVDVGVIMKKAVLCSAKAIALAHNHPSGNLRPSEADIQLTKKVIGAGKLMDIASLDHIIFASDGYYSFADEGMMTT